MLQHRTMFYKPLLVQSCPLTGWESGERAPPSCGVTPGRGAPYTFTFEKRTFEKRFEKRPIAREVRSSKKFVSVGGGLSKMTEPWSHLEGQMRELRKSLDDVHRRLARVEARLAQAPATGASSSAADTSGSPASGRGGASKTVAAGEGAGVTGLAETLGLVGRIFLVLGGGYLLRAITESGVVPAPLGLSLGMLYAVLWILFADRAAGAGKGHSALAHGVAAALLGYPLIFETSVRFGFLTAWGAAGALAGVSALMLLVAWRRRLVALRWVAALGAVITAFVILAGLQTASPFAAALLALGLVTLWDDPDRKGPVLRWFTALAADLAVLLLTVEAIGAPGRSSMEVVLGLQLALPLLYVGSLGTLDLWKRRAIDTFAMFQSSAALLVGLGGAVMTVWEGGGLATVLGGVLLALAAVGYTFAFRVVDRSYRRSFHLFATVGMALLLAGSALLLPWRALLWAVLAVLSAVLAAWFGRVSLAFQAALWALAAALAAGLEVVALHAYANPEAQGWPPYTPEVVAAWVAALLCLALPRPSAAGAESFPARASRFVLSLILLVGVTTSLLYGVVWAVPPAGTDPGALSVLRTAIAAAAAVGLAWVGRYRRLREARWWVYPTLVLAGLKLLFEDLTAGRPGTLFLSFVLYGSALILAPRLLRRPTEEEAGGR